MKNALFLLVVITLLSATAVVADPIIGVQPHDLNFGPVELDSQADLPLAIFNRGDATLIILNVITEAEYFSTDFAEETSIEPGQSFDLTISYAPEEEGNHHGALEIVSNDPLNELFAMHILGYGGEWFEEISYDNGNPVRQFEDLSDGDMEAVCFTPQHPCSLASVRLRVTRAGELDLHIWGDNGAHEPDQNNNLIEPMIINVENANDWVTIDLSVVELLLDPPQDFHIGHVIHDGGPQFWLDDADDGFQQRGHLWTYNEGLGQSVWHTLPGSYLARVTVQYVSACPSFTFRDVSASAGIGGISKSAWGDYDNDGWEDLLVNGRQLYRNNGDGTFTDVSNEAGTLADNPSHTGTWGDFNNDGWLDFMSLLSGAAEDRLYQNNGDGTFTLVNDLYEFHHANNPTAAMGWGDANLDGFLDFHIANSENWNGGNPEYFQDYYYQYYSDFEIYLNRTPMDISRHNYYGRSVAWCDFDMDGDMDYYLSNYRLQPNQLMVNDGNAEFTDQADAHGQLQGYNVMNAYGHTIGSQWADFDNDLDFDLIVGNFAHPWGLDYQDKVMLCRNNGAPDYDFTDIREGSGIEYCETVFCPAFGDFDNDGWQDVFISSVYDGRQPFLYRNTGDGEHFENVNYVSGFHGTCYNSYGVSWCDYDHDGDLDVAIGNGGLFENTGSHGNWLELNLRGTSPTVNKFAFGSMAFVYSGDSHYLRQVEGGSGAESSQNAATLHFGLGEADHIDSLVVRWIGGGEERFYDLNINRRYDVIEGEGLLAAPQAPSERNLPLAFGLTGAYPNPFNSISTIAYALNDEMKVDLAVYNLQGQRIAMLDSGVKSAGRHSVAWKANNVPSGIYFVRLSAKGYSSSQRILLVK